MVNMPGFSYTVLSAALSYPSAGSESESRTRDGGRSIPLHLLSLSFSTLSLLLRLRVIHTRSSRNSERLVQTREDTDIEIDRSIDSFSWLTTSETDDVTFEWGWKDGDRVTWYEEVKRSGILRQSNDRTCRMYWGYGTNRTFMFYELYFVKRYQIDIRS